MNGLPFYLNNISLYVYTKIPMVSLETCHARQLWPAKLKVLGSNPIRKQNLTILQSLPELVVVLLLHGRDDPAAVLDLVSLLDAGHEVGLHRLSGEEKFF